MTLAQVRDIFDQAEALGGIEGICLEGGEPSMYYPTLLETARQVRARGWLGALLTNAYWATSHEDALVFLRPLAGLPLHGLYVSEDTYHGTGEDASPTRVAGRAAQELGIRVTFMSVRPPAQSVSCFSPLKGR
jgi:hypothetical protein